MILIDFENHDFDLDSKDIIASNYDYLFSPINVKDDITVTGGYASDGDVCLYVKNASKNLPFSVYLSFTYKPDSTKPNLIWSDSELFIGHKFTLKGIYSFHKNSSGTISYQINPRSGEDFICLDL